MRSLYLLLLTCTSLGAQTVTVTTEALTPLPVTMSQGGQAWTQSLPAGPLAGSGNVTTILPGAVDYAQLRWGSNVSAIAATHSLELSTQLYAADYAQVGVGEVLVTFTGSGLASMPCVFDVFVTGQAANMFIDVGNNGTFDWLYGQGTGSADIATQPLQLRIRFDTITAQAGSRYSTLNVRVRPAYDIHVFRLSTSCGSSADFSVDTLFDPTFADIRSSSSHTSWHVLGLTSQPVLLPIALTQTTAPCMLIPSPDVILRTGGVFLKIPPVIRPATLYLQLVDLTPAGLRVSDTFQVIAF